MLDYVAIITITTLMSVLLLLILISYLVFYVPNAFYNYLGQGMENVCHTTNFQYYGELTVSTSWDNNNYLFLISTDFGLTLMNCDPNQEVTKYLPPNYVTKNIITGRNVSNPKSTKNVYYGAIYTFTVNDQTIDVISLTATFYAFEWKQDFDYTQVTSTYIPGSLHKGFYTIYDYIRPEIQDYFSKRTEPTITYITGHSLGGALSTLCYYDVMKNLAPDSNTVGYLLASPRVGNNIFARAFDELSGIVYFRVVNDSDLVPAAPFPSMGNHVYYTHVGNSTSTNVVWFNINLGTFAKNHENAYLQFGGITNGV